MDVTYTLTLIEQKYGTRWIDPIGLLTELFSPLDWGSHRPRTTSEHMSRVVSAKNELHPAPTNTTEVRDFPQLSKCVWTRTFLMNQNILNAPTTPVT